MLLKTIALSTVADIIAAVTGSYIKVWKIQMSLDGTGTGTVHAGTAGTGNDLISASCVAGSQVVMDYSTVGGYRLPISTALKGTASAGNMKGVVYYTISP